MMSNSTAELRKKHSKKKKKILKWFFGQTNLKYHKIVMLIFKVGMGKSLAKSDQFWNNISASSWDYGTFYIGNQRRLRRACANLARAFAVGTHEVWMKTKDLTKNQTSSPTGWLRMCVWRISLRRTKISWDGSFTLLQTFVVFLSLSRIFSGLFSANDMQCFFSNNKWYYDTIYYNQRPLALHPALPNFTLFNMEKVNSITTVKYRSLTNW